MKRKALGKGMNVLIPGKVQDANSLIQMIPLDQIRPARNQPRRRFNPENLAEMAESIKECGVILPLLVRPVTGGYELIAGERRLRAGQLSGLKLVPVIVRKMDDSKALELALIENIQRQNLNPVEEAMGYATLMEEYQLTQEDVARKVGKNRATVANTLRLLKLPPKVQKMLLDDQISFGHAKVLLSLKSPNKILLFARLVMQHQWSVRQLEKQIKTPDNSPAKTIDSAQDPILNSALDQLRQRFATKIAVKPRKKGGGTMTLEYYSDEDLVRIFELMGGGQL